MRERERETVRAAKKEKEEGKVEASLFSLFSLFCRWF
jgi:ribosomal 50S subunit-associated protein YjgA (DUF615 family)